MLAEAIRDVHTKSTLSLKAFVQHLLIKPSGFIDARNLAWYHPTLIDRVMTFRLVVRAQRFIEKHNGLFLYTLEDQHGTELSMLVNADDSLAEKLHRAEQNRSFIFINARLELWNGQPTLKQPRWVPEAWIGGIYPTFSSVRGKMSGRDIQTEILSIAEKVVTSRSEHAKATLELRELLSLSSESLQAILNGYEFPDLASLVRGLCSFTDATIYRRALRCMALLNCIDYIASAQPDNNQPFQARISIDQQQLQSINNRFNSIGIELTRDQRSSIGNLIACYDHGRKHAMLSGDVGTGKSLVIAGLAVLVAQSDGRVAIMVPNEGLANQIRDVVVSLAGRDSCVLVTGCQKPNLSALPPILIGTTALLNFTQRSQLQFDLVVIDEEHKMGKSAKEGLITDCTLMIASTATCIPRTLQLTTLRDTVITKLKSRHVDRNVTTSLLMASQSAIATDAIKRTLERKQKVLIVLPVSKGNSSKYLNALSVEENLKRWDAFLPGRVVAYHAAQSPDERSAALEGVAKGLYDIIIATSAAETGLNIPKLSYCLVLEPKRFGLIQLHQIRGRLGRQGEVSQFHMLPVTAHAEDRIDTLRILESEDDGFAIAEHDLELRGFGCLGPVGTSQSGHATHLITNYKITPSILMQAVEHFKTLPGQNS